MCLKYFNTDIRQPKWINVVSERKKGINEEGIKGTHIIRPGEKLKGRRKRKKET